MPRFFGIRIGSSSSSRSQSRQGNDAAESSSSRTSRRHAHPSGSPPRRASSPSPSSSPPRMSREAAEAHRRTENVRHQSSELRHYAEQHAPHLGDQTRQFYALEHQIWAQRHGVPVTDDHGRQIELGADAFERRLERAAAPVREHRESMQGEKRLGEYAGSPSSQDPDQYDHDGLRQRADYYGHYDGYWPR